MNKRTLSTFSATKKMYFVTNGGASNAVLSTNLRYEVVETKRGMLYGNKMYKEYVNGDQVEQNVTGRGKKQRGCEREDK